MNALALKFLAGILSLAALVGGGYWWGNSAATNRDDAKALITERAAAKELATANDRVRDAEHKATQDFADASSTYQTGLINDAITRQATTTRIRAGTLRLSVPTRSVLELADGSAAASAIGRDDQTRTELSITASEFFTGLTSEADDVVKQLIAAQAIIEADRVACSTGKTNDRTN